MRRRLRVLNVIRDRPHALDRWQSAGITVTVILLWAIPTSGLVRLDLWSGDHRALFAPVHWLYAATGVPAAWVGLYILTFFANWGLGRVFCGFGCPLGRASRYADLMELGHRRGSRAAAWKLAALALLVGGGLLHWFVSPRVWWAGGVNDVGRAAAAWIGLGAAVVLHARYGRWSFCVRWCPISIYYTAVQLTHRFGVHYRPDVGVCDECGLCEPACPVGLRPKNLGEPHVPAGGLSIEGFPGTHYCLQCGDCVRACAYNHRRGADVIPALTMDIEP